MSDDPIEIDDDLITQVMTGHGLASRTAAVDYALRQLLLTPVTSLTPPAPMTREDALGMRGSGWDVRPNTGVHGHDPPSP